ncbi:MAG: U32 family peptidase [Oligoflexia bacterium]|nr:U32 family peptidase [Oligoflexia bacterium]
MEILAPVGRSLSLLKNIIRHGADAVYFGVRPLSISKSISKSYKQDQFSLIWPAFEFDYSSAVEAIKLLQHSGKRSYITMNLPYTKDQFDSVLELSLKLIDAGVSALIVSDPGLVSKLKIERPKCELHVSIIGRTINSQAAIFWKELGCSRVILDRSLSVVEISSIIEESTMEVEVFVYGNTCFFYHGGCRLSSYFFGEACIGPCMDKYSIEGFEFIPKKPFRSKIFNAYEFLPHLFNMGVHTIKIEGRQKSDLYIINTLKIFRKAVDALKSGHPLPPIDNSGINFLFAGHKDSTCGFLAGDPQLSNNIIQKDTTKSFLRNIATYLTPTGIKVGLNMRKRRSAKR